MPFIDDMAAHYAQADLVICRAGASTIAELAAAGVASVLVPFPHAVDDHQTSNARFLAGARCRGADPAARTHTARNSPICCARFTRETACCEMANKARSAGQAGCDADASRDRMTAWRLAA